MLKIAVIGLGKVSEVHLTAIKKNPNVKLVAVCDIDKAKNNFKDVTFYTDYQNMLNNQQLDCVHICLPHHLHYTVTKMCVEKGLHVFLEKPLARNLKESVEFIKLEEQNQHVKICVCFQNRLNETFETLQEITDSEEYGKVIGI